jgi:hypothetical protein
VAAPTAAAIVTSVGPAECEFPRYPECSENHGRGRMTDTRRLAQHDDLNLGRATAKFRG